MQGNLSEIESSRKDNFRAVESIAERIKHVRHLRRRSQERFAVEIGVTRGAVGNWELGGDISRDNLAKIAELYGVSMDWLEREAGPPPDADSKDGFPEAQPAPYTTPVSAQTAPGASARLMGQQPGTRPGSFLWTGEQIGAVEALPNLRGIRGAYAVYMPDDTMEPRYYPDDYVFVDPNRQPRPGHVVLALVAGEGGGLPTAYIAKLIERSALRLRLQQINPKKDLSFPPDKVMSVHRTLTGGER